MRVIPSWLNVLHNLIVRVAFETFTLVFHSLLVKHRILTGLVKGPWIQPGVDFLLASMLWPTCLTHLDHGGGTFVPKEWKSSSRDKCSSGNCLRIDYAWFSDSIDVPIIFRVYNLFNIYVLVCPIVKDCHTK